MPGQCVWAYGDPAAEQGRYGSTVLDVLIGVFVLALLVLAKLVIWNRRPAVAVLENIPPSDGDPVNACSDEVVIAMPLTSTDSSRGRADRSLSDPDEYR